MAPPMKATTRRSLLRVWRVMTWPLSGHVALALGTGLACGSAAARYPEMIAPPYAAIIGAVVAYPAIVATWWYFTPPGASGR